MGTSRCPHGCGVRCRRQASGQGSQPPHWVLLLCGLRPSSMLPRERPWRQSGHSGTLRGTVISSVWADRAKKPPNVCDTSSERRLTPPLETREPPEVEGHDLPTPLCICQLCKAAVSWGHYPGSLHAWLLSPLCPLPREASPDHSSQGLLARWSLGKRQLRRAPRGAVHGPGQAPPLTASPQPQAAVGGWQQPGGPHRAATQPPPPRLWPRQGLLSAALWPEVKERRGAPKWSPRFLTAGKQRVSKTRG